jgi:hypothetical protein
VNESDISPRAYTRPTGYIKMQISVMPAWIAGIQIRRMRPETSMPSWIPALHAGMTQSRDSACTDRPAVFQRSHEEHEDQER